MLSITPVYASLLVLLILTLAYRVTVYRRRESVALGEKKASTEMLRAVRAHANAVENVPLALLLMVFLELNHLTPWLLHVFGLTLVVGRLLHAWGLNGATGLSTGRFYGTILTWLSMAAMAALNIVIIFSRG